MAPQTRREYTFRNYLANERQTVDAKHEFVAGHAYAMTAAADNHHLIVANLSRQLGNRLESPPCTVLGSDMRVGIETADAGMYLDIVTLCDAPRFYDQRHDVLLNPTLVCEVLSPSTDAYDPGEKLAIYRTLPDLREYVLVAQDRHSVEVFTRQNDNRWLLRACSTPDDEAVFESIQCHMPLREIYAKVQFEPSDGVPRNRSPPWDRAGKTANRGSSEFYTAGCGSAGAGRPLRRCLVTSARYGQDETPRLRQVSITLIESAKAQVPSAVRVP